jgi:hypothetical protein
MEWPTDLLELFEDPLMAGIHPKAPTLSADDRMALKLEEVTRWVEAHGREPRMSGDLTEKKHCVALKALRRDSHDRLKDLDRLNLLG